ncbi:bifunctional pyr operon transcriptional regulator/uracil phosphoribosyltransferase PyrR [Algiphilus sp.]|uniref:bifunctional pyr operon transcriptional regulator/uracil phosphoribosyltransferase PyrR n=1 Tax=Algiphilus sp. TaxID=1872431 RepID=UPI0032EC3255
MAESGSNDRDPDTTARLIAGMAQAIAAELPAPPTTSVLVGIERGGVAVAEALRAQLPAHVGFGTVDVSFHRDDYAHRGLRTARPSDLPHSLEDTVVVLVDDVLQTGRTARAAMEVLFERGRPARVLLAALATRPGRQLPIQPDVVGVALTVRGDTHVAVEEAPLRIRIEEGPR